MFFPEITGNKCMKFLQNVVFTTDLFFDNGLSGKKICYIQKSENCTLPVYAGKGNDVQLFIRCINTSSSLWMI